MNTPANIPHFDIPDLDIPDLTLGQIALLRKTLDHITAHRDQWNQGVWVNGKAEFCLRAIDAGSCGTVGCLAGWAVLLAGHQVDPWSQVVLDVNPADYQDDDVDLNMAPHVAIVAQRDLGLPDGHDLFYGRNTLNDLWRLARHYSGGEIEIPPEFS